MRKLAPEPTLHDRLRNYFAAAGISFEYTWCGGARVYIVDGQYYSPGGAEVEFLGLPDPDLTAPQTAGPRYTVLKVGASHDVYDHETDEIIAAGWTYFEAAILRNRFNGRLLCVEVTD